MGKEKPSNFLSPEHVVSQMLEVFHACEHGEPKGCLCHWDCQQSYRHLQLLGVSKATQMYLVQM